MSHNTGEKDFGSHTIDEQGRIVPNYISDADPNAGVTVHTMRYFGRWMCYLWRIMCYFGRRM